MKRIGVDTNVVVSFLTDRDLQQQARAAEVFGAAAAGEHLVVMHQAVVTESVYVLRNVYGARAKAVSASMADLLELPGVMTVHDIDWRSVWAMWPTRTKDFGDACLMVSANAGHYDELATFDTSFARRARKRGIVAHW